MNDAIATVSFKNLVKTRTRSLTNKPCILTSLTDSFTASKASLLTSSFKPFSFTYLLTLLSDQPLEM